MSSQQPLRAAPHQTYIPSHSQFEIPIDSETSLANDVPKYGSIATLIRATTLIIWDKASMATKENVESLDLLLCNICDTNLRFGGKIIVLVVTLDKCYPLCPRNTKGSCWFKLSQLLALASPHQVQAY